MNDFGYYSLFLAWFLALVGTVFGSWAGIRMNKSAPGAVRALAAERAIVLSTFLAVLSATFALGYCFHTDDYTNQYVWQYSNRDMAGVYKVSAIWGGMDGSMLLWCFILSVCAAIVSYRVPQYPRALSPWVLTTLSSSLLFFLTVTLFVTNPFRYLKAPFIPADGNGLNPLLQNEFMAIHPPMLYTGFTAHAVPYAFCMAALLSGNLSAEWIRLTRRWALVAWMFLTCGIVLGGYWAYIELGWGGFWAWDPVENSSFLPWLTSTAYLHSVMVQERKNMLKAWNVWLMVLTYALTVLGTFLTRSGVVQSVHAFASTDVGWVFMLYLGVVLVTAAALTVYRRRELKSERRIESVWSREAFFLLNNLVLLSIAFATLWGVLFPVLSEAVTGQKQAVGIPFFNTINVPLFLGLVFLMGAGPLIAWRRATFSSLLRTFAAPFIVALALAALLVIVGITEFYPVLSYGLCAFVVMTVLSEFHRGVKAQRGAGGPAGYLESTERLLTRHRVRYGGYLVHIGVVIVTIAITSSMAYKFEKEFTLASGDSIDVRRYKLTLIRVEDVNDPNWEGVQAIVNVKERASGETIGTLTPQLRRYRRNQETTTEVALSHSWKDDLYLVIAGLNEDGSRASFKVFVNPLQVWLWAGTFIMLLGTGIVLAPRRTTQPALQFAPNQTPERG